MEKAKGEKADRKKDRSALRHQMPQPNNETVGGGRGIKGEQMKHAAHCVGTCQCGARRDNASSIFLFYHLVLSLSI